MKNKLFFIGWNNVTVAISSASDKKGEAATVYVLDNTGKVLFSQK